MKREIRDVRDKLRVKSKALKGAKFEKTIKKKGTVERLIKEQDEIYKKFDFYNNFIKASEKVNKG